MLTQPRKRGRPPKPGLAESRREQILAAATELFAREGFAQTDLQQVADALGIGKGTVYRYFPSKRARWRPMYDGLIASGVLREVPVERIMDAISAVVYGAMFTNFFLGRTQNAERQAGEILDVVFRGILKR